MARAELAVCSAELARAQAIGVIPQYGRLDSPKLMRTNVEGRFVCVAATHLTKYLIAADLRCNNLADPQCVSVVRIALMDGTVVYSRPE
ncbi:MAG: hypothetical protein ACLQUZ_16740 [Rhizomicrobium sp.]